MRHLLCVGDLGVYTSFHAMEKTSQRLARKHPEELGFSKFLFHFDGAPPTLQRVAAVVGAIPLSYSFAAPPSPLRMALNPWTPTKTARPRSTADAAARG